MSRPHSQTPRCQHGYRSLTVSLEARPHEPLLTNENVIVHRAGVRLVPTATSGVRMDTQPGASPAG